MSGRHVLLQPCLMLVTEPHPNLREVVGQALAGGVNTVQLRDKAAQRFELMATAQELRPLVQPPNLLIVNGDYGAVARAGADGTQMSRAPTRTIAADGGRGLLGVSVHSAADAREAEQLGADYLIAGTVFASQSHSDVAPQGLDYLRDVCAAVSIPTLAIGGITPARVGICINAGAAGVAVLSPIMRADDPEAVAREYCLALDAAWKAKQCT